MMEQPLVDLINVYKLHPTDVRRGIGMRMIIDGALTREEEDDLFKALEERIRVRDQR